MKKCDFPIGNGLKLSLNECGSVYFGHVHISIWRSLMPIETLRSGLETDVRIVMERKPIFYFILKKLDFIN